MVDSNKREKHFRPYFKFEEKAKFFTITPKTSTDDEADYDRRNYFQALHNHLCSLFKSLYIHTFAGSKRWQRNRVHCNLIWFTWHTYTYNKCKYIIKSAIHMFCVVDANGHFSPYRYYLHGKGNFWTIRENLDIYIVHIYWLSITEWTGESNWIILCSMFVVCVCVRGFHWPYFHHLKVVIVNIEWLCNLLLVVFNSFEITAEKEKYTHLFFKRKSRSKLNPVTCITLHFEQSWKRR